MLQSHLKCAITIRPICSCIFLEHYVKLTSLEATSMPVNLVTLNNSIKYWCSRPNSTCHYKGNKILCYDMRLSARKEIRQSSWWKGRSSQNECKSNTRETTWYFYQCFFQSTKSFVREVLVRFHGKTTTYIIVWLQCGTLFLQKMYYF